MSAELASQVAALHQENFAWALGCCRRDRREAEEVLQSVYLKVLDGRARFDGRSSLKTWAFAVIRRTAAQHRRLAWFRRLRLVPLSAGPDVASDQPGADETAETAERREQLERGLERLSPRQREERRFAEMRVADRRGIPPFDAVVGLSRRRWAAGPLVAAAALVVVVAGVVLIPRLHREKTEAAGIAEWQSPTAALLVVPGSDLLRKVPSISESVIHLEEQ